MLQIETLQLLGKICDADDEGSHDEKELSPSPPIYKLELAIDVLVAGKVAFY
jgi:hypothetical protein